MRLFWSIAFLLVTLIVGAYLGLLNAFLLLVTFAGPRTSNDVPTLIGLAVVEFGLLLQVVLTLVFFAATRPVKLARAREHADSASIGLHLAGLAGGLIMIGGASYIRFGLDAGPDIDKDWTVYVVAYLTSNVIALTLRLAHWRQFARGAHEGGS